MRVKQRTKRIKDTRREAFDSEIEAFLKAEDLRLFCEKKSARLARIELQDSVNAQVSAKKFSEAIYEHCEWFRQWKRKPVRKNSSLTSRQWDRQIAVVSNLLLDIQGVPLSWAIEIVRTRISTNGSILDGLPLRLQVWGRRKFS